MSIFENLNQFLETRLEEFLRSHPNLQLQILLEQLDEQEKDTTRLIQQLQTEKDSLEKEILALGEDIKLWHGRIDIAKAANRNDLMQAAQEREAALLRQGNQVWGRMEGAKKRLLQSQELLTQIKKRRQEVEVKYKAAKPEPPKNTDSESKGWQNSANYNRYKGSVDPLEAAFQGLDIDDELDKLKRNRR